jgi:cell division protein ZapA (FtsZ GTPase activity inhibitor)
LEQLVTIELFGHPFTFKAETDAAQAKEVADFLVAEVTKAEVQLSSKSSNVTKRIILILAALNIANQYFELKQNHSDLLQNISERSTSLIGKIETRLQ